jgi:hypothetical protein
MQVRAFRQGVEAAGNIISIIEAQSGDNVYAFCLVLFDELSGRGRFLDNGQNPSPGGVGHPISSGGTFIEVAGWKNIQGLRFTNETGQTLNWSYSIFQ